MQSIASREQPRPVTGRLVFLCLLAFFGTITAMNLVLVYFATSTFGGVETQNAYKAGLAFNRDIEAAHRQEALQWDVSGRVSRNDGQAHVDVTLRDARGLPVTGLSATARLAHPSDARLDRFVTLREARAGAFTGAVDASPGQWTLVFDAYRGEERMFRSRARVVLR